VRQRAALKSPVREYRTPGSVRGPSGNWRSYLDYSSSLNLSLVILPLAYRVLMMSRDVSSKNPMV
jgi:hypothetical protein